MKALKRQSIAALALLALLAGCSETTVPLEAGDRVVLIGNALAERMQHDGWLETYLQTELPDLELVFRNHGFAGDRIDHRPRVRDFPGADEYLAWSETDVILAMFGYNESFDEDPEGFGDAVVRWIEHTRGLDYSGNGTPEIVLLAPIAHENLANPNLPDGADNNTRLAAYADAMGRAASASGVRFVDLFAASQQLYVAADTPLTINGVHLGTEGNRQIAEVIVEELIGRSPSAEGARVETVRAAVLEKNWHWFNRYRTTDGNDVWGSRSTLAFVNGQTNYEVLQRELVQLDVMTANRDLAIHAAARGEYREVDDSNVPEPIAVESNLGDEQLQDGVSKTGTLEYLGAEEAIDRMTLADGLEANVFASEEMFPELVNPVQLGVDPAGRMWAATWGTYPKWEPTGEMNDRLVILPDDDRDGVADRAITFAYVHNPTGFEFWNGGVIVASVPDLIFLKDTDGDDVADVRIPILGALGSADTHHSANNFIYGPDGFLYYQRGVFNVSNVETPWGPNQLSDASGMYRFNPRTWSFSFHAANSPNAHGTDFDYWGYHYATDATGGRAYQVKPEEDGRFTMEQLLDQTVRPVPSSGIFSSDHFPPKYEQNFLILNVIAFLGIKQYTLDRDPDTGAVWGSETEDLLYSSDPNFRPTDFEVGDDGGLYVADWSNAVIGHMQHNIRDPARDHSHGRIYRVTATGRPLSEHVPIGGAPIPALLEALEYPVNGVRRRARSELSQHDPDDVIAATELWMQQFDATDAADAHHLLEALWLHQQFNVENTELLALLLNSPEPHARVAARNVEYAWEHELAGAYGFDTAVAESVYIPTRDPDPDAIVIRAVPDEMRFDVTDFTVNAGETVKIWFENPDYTPHNLVLGMPDSAEEIALAAEGLGALGFAVGFLPDSDKVLMATDLLNQGEYQVLEFTAPEDPGDYDYVCTFPNHWQTMRGVMQVLAREEGE